MCLGFEVPWYRGKCVFEHPRHAVMPTAWQAIPDRPNFVRASFERPWLNLFGKNGLTFRLGQKSIVTLGTTYVDERVRTKRKGLPPDA